MTTYTLTELSDKRNELAGLIEQAEKQARQYRADLAHVEAVIRILRPGTELPVHAQRCAAHRYWVAVERGTGRSRRSTTVARIFGESPLCKLRTGAQPGAARATGPAPLPTFPMTGSNSPAGWEAVSPAQLAL